MTESEHKKTTERLAEALRLHAAFVADGRQDRAGFLAEHAEFADLLEGMFADPEFSEAGDALAKPPEPTLSIPTEFGDYTIEGELGRGGMGIVVAARQRSLGRRIALKLLSRPLLQQTRALLRFQREARVLARLEHPGIVRVIDAGMVGDVPYYAMDLVDGAPLSAVIEAVRRHGLATASGATVMAAVAGALERAAPPDTNRAPTAVVALRQRTYLGACAELGAQIADALAFAHAAGVVHRDVKPSNVLLRNDGTVVLTDFGLARQEGAASMTFTGEFAGTALYMSPEQTRGDPIDHRTDVYSLGVVLYELVTLHRPFDGDTTAQLFARIQREEPTDPGRTNPRVTDDLAAVVAKAMAKEPALRYAGAGELAADLRAWRDGLPVVARRPSRWQRLRRFVRREPWQAAAFGTAAAAAVVVAALSIGFTAKVIAEREIAHANLDQAMRVVDEFLSRVGRQEFEHIPQMSAVRRDLLQRAAQFYEGFLLQRSQDPRVQRQLATAQDWLGFIRRELGDRQAAIAAHTAAITTLDALLANDRADADAHLARAEAQTNLAAACSELGRRDAARTHLDEAIATLQALPAATPRPRALRSTLAFALGLRAGLLRASDSRQAMVDVRAAIALLEVVATEQPTAVRERAKLATHRLMLAAMEINAGNTTAAEMLLATARDEADQLATSAPEHVGVRRLACLTRDQLAILYHDTGKSEAAADTAALAVQHWQRLVADFPLVPDYREQLGRAWSNLSGMRKPLGDRDGAAKAAREAITVQEQLVADCPDIPRYRYRLVRALVSGWRSEVAGKERAELHARALAVAEQLHRDHPAHTDYAKVLADVLVDDGLEARERNDREHAKRSFARAMDVTAAAVASDSNSGELRDAHAFTQCLSAEEAHAGGEHAPARELIERGLGLVRSGLQQEPRHPSRRVCMRRLLAVSFQVAIAVGDYERAVSALADHANYCDSAEDCYAVAVNAALAAKTVLASQRGVLVDHGLLMLQQSLERGFADADRLANDAALATLRTDPRFAALQRAMAR